MRTLVEPETDKTRSTSGSFDVLSVSVNATQIPQMIETIEEWIAERRASRYVTLTNVHAIVEATRHAAFKAALDSAECVCPDGMPLIWLGRMKGFVLPRRVYGPDLLWEFCRTTHQKGYSHFFYGGAEGIPERLAECLKKEFPGLQVSGCYSPPFRQLSPEEDREVVERINTAAPDILWVGLGCPKQEIWMMEHREYLRVPAVLGVGQAFDIFAGATPQAPPWMRERGLEWLFRLFCEPRRLWKRYAIYNSVFVIALVRDYVRRALTLG